MAVVPADLEKDCVLLYDEEDLDAVVKYVEEIEEYLKHKCTVGIPQRDGVPGTSVITTLSASLSNTGQDYLVFNLWYHGNEM